MPRVAIGRNRLSYQTMRRMAEKIQRAACMANARKPGASGQNFGTPIRYTNFDRRRCILKGESHIQMQRKGNIQWGAWLAQHS